MQRMWSEEELKARGMAPAVIAGLGRWIGAVRDLRCFAGSCRSAQEAAALLGVTAEQVVKSLVFINGGCEGTGEPILVLAPGHRRVDEARLAAVLGGAVRPARASQVRVLTGFAVGAVPPVGHRRRLKTFMDAALHRHPLVWASAGTVRSMMALAPADLAAAARADAIDLG